MPSPFATTAATNTILLNVNAPRQGEVAFTVSNLSGRALRGRARLNADNPVALPWLTLVGEPERDFAIAATEQFAVRVAVPPDAPPGNYSFRLDMVGVTNPDEEFSQGPPVTFTVPPPPPPRPPFPWWIVIVAVVVLALLCGGIGGGAYLLTRPTATPTATVTPTASPTPPPTATGTNVPLEPTDTPAPTGTPLFSSGLVTYKLSEGGTISLYVVQPDGTQIALVTGAVDADVLDYSPESQRFALWVNQGGQEVVIVIGPAGEESRTLNGGWTSIDEANFAPDGQTVIVQAKQGTAVQYFYYLIDGTLLNTSGANLPGRYTVTW